jgi:hypothetical protein
MTVLSVFCANAFVRGSAAELRGSRQLAFGVAGPHPHWLSARHIQHKFDDLSSHRDARVRLGACAQHGISRIPREGRRTVLCRGGTPGLMNLPLARDLDEPLDGFDSIASAVEDLAAGKFVVVLDDEDRENEGDLIIAGHKVD